MTARFTNPKPQFSTDSGKLVPGGKLSFFESGTTTPKQTFSDVGLTTPNANPVILDASGRIPDIFANDSDLFAVELISADDVVIWAKIDNVSFVAAFSLSSADVLAALASNSAAVVINGASMTGTAFTSFASALDLSAAGSINASAGAITLGTVTGATTFSSALTVSTGGLTVTAGDLTMTAGDMIADLHKNIDDVSSTVVSGGTAGSGGANIIMFGPSHATQGNDFAFRSSTITKLGWDDSADLWTMAGDLTVPAGDITAGDGQGSENIKINAGAGLNAELFLQNNGVTAWRVGEASSGTTFRIRDELNNFNGLEIDTSQNVTVPNGDLTVSAGDTIFSGAITQALRRSADTSTLRISGGDAQDSGGNIVLFGGAHSTDANDVVFRKNTIETLRYDDSASQWEFKTNVVMDGNITLGTPTINSGSGSPEGSLTAPVGSTFMRTDGSTGTSFYVKESGASNTGWISK